MINNYYIKTENNKEILYINLDIDDDFAFNKQSIKDIKDIIIKYIKDKNIIFKGSLVVIMVSGIIVGSVNINKPNTYTNNITNINYQTSNNIKYVKVYRKNNEVLNIELEEYVIGVVAAEMPASFHMEALKSQAIIARTYALKCINNNVILTDTSSTQNYKSNKELKKLWGANYNKYYKKIKEAVNSTKGMYLTYNGQIIEALYHSTSNGRTEDASYVWKNKVPYLVSTSSKYDKTNKSYKVTKTISYKQLTKLLGYKVDKKTTFKIISRTKGNRVYKYKIKNKVYTGVDLRTLLNLRSADFKIKKTNKGITITTYGYGHGVGLSQYGANGYAKNGYKYDKILKHYYKGIKINRLVY